MNKTGKEEEKQEVQDEELDDLVIDRIVSGQDYEYPEDKEETEETIEEVAEEKEEEKEVVEEKPAPLEGAFFEDLRKQFPDKQIGSQEEYESFVKDLAKYHVENTKANEEVLEIFKKNPEVLAIVKDMTEGRSFRSALARQFDVETLTAQEGDPDFEDVEKSKSERKKQLAEQKKQEEEAQKAASESLATIETFRTDNELDEPTMAAFFDQVVDMVTEINKGRITKRTLDVMFKALNFNTAVEDARIAGEVRGRNEKIEKEKGKKAQQGDGLPDVASRGNEVKNTKNLDPFSQGIGKYINKHERGF